MPPLKESNYTVFSLKLKQDWTDHDPSKHYSMVYCFERTKNHFNKIVSTLPRESGKVLIFGETKQNLKLLGTFSRSSNLRCDFRNHSETRKDGNTKDHFSWMVGLLQNEGLKRLRIYATSVV